MGRWQVFGSPWSASARAPARRDDASLVAAAAAQHRGAYRPDIDGLRAVAVLAVVLYHAGFGVVSGGYVGVDVFFVISGYVISKSLFADLEGGRFSVAGFYERRVRRIFPALFATLAATSVVAVVLLLPSYLTDYARSLAAAAAFVSNLYFWKNSGYFANGADLRPLLHTWSLAVEEQFYIFAPLALAFIHRYLKARWTAALAPLVIASFALSVVAARIGPTANFFLLPMRAWELLLGAWLALARPPEPRGLRAEALALLGVALILWPVFLYTPATPFPGVTALPPCLGTAALIYAGSSARPWASRLISAPPMVTVGLISYSLYLVHWPIISFFTYYALRPPKPGEGAAIVAASLILAYLSWRFVEQPFRSRRFRPPRRWLLAGAGASLAAVAGLGLLCAASGGLPARFPQVADRAERPKSFGAESVCFLDNNPDPSRWTASACTLTHGGPPALLWGDSYAAHYAAGVQAYAARIPFSVIQYTAAGCPPVLAYEAYNRPGCQPFNRHALDVIRQLDIKTVVLSARWVDLQRRGLSELKSTLNALRSLGVTTYVIGQSPMFTTDVHLIGWREGLDQRLDAWPVSFDPDLNRKLAARVGPNFVDPIARLCQGASCPYRDQGQLLFADEGHFSTRGSVWAVGRIFPLLAAPTTGGASRG
jgi:peptidoglycan/LPS O-acetylase OafA/YrhL